MSRKLILFAIFTVCFIPVIVGCTTDKPSVAVRWHFIDNFDTAYARPASGNCFVVIKVSVENKGLRSLKVSPYALNLVVKNVCYKVNALPVLASKKPLLPMVEVEKGGIVEGLIAFEVPAGDIEAYLDIDPAYARTYSYRGGIDWIPEPNAND